MTTTESVLGYTADGFPIVPIRGAERGYSTAGDVAARTIDGQPINDLFAEFQTTLDILNEQRSAVARLLAFPTVRSADGVVQSTGDDDFERASEFGEPKSIAAKPDIVTVGYEFADWDLATRFTARFLRDATAAEVESVHTRALAADNKLVNTTILARLLSSAPGENADGRTTYGLWSGDDMVPPRYGFRSFAAGHSHYLSTQSASADGGDLDAMIRHITEHGYGTRPGSRLILFLNPDELPAIVAVRAGGSALAQYDFIPGAGAPAYLTQETIVGDVAPADFNHLSITGSYGPMWVVPTEFMPPGYLLAVATDGPNSPLNPMGFREHPNTAHQGVRLLPGPSNAYPLIDSYYTRAFGVGVRHRGAAVVMQITTSATYAAPTL